MQILGFERKDIQVIYNLWKMNLKDRYMGSSLGVIWAFLQPALFLALYVFVFTFAFHAGSPDNSGRFTNIIWMFTGMIPYLVFSDAITTGANCLISSSSLVKNIVFKSETIPVAFSLNAVVPLAVGTIFLIILLLFNDQSLSWYALMLIPIIIIQFMFLIGLVFFISATVVFFRDIIQIIPTIMMMCLFFTPIFYPITSMPPFAADITVFNPLYQIVQSYRDILINHTFPSLFGMIYVFSLSIVLIIFGLGYFRRLKGFFELAL